MNTKKARQKNIHDPDVAAAALERLRTMPIEELDALLTPKEGVEVTNMNDELAQWYRKQAAKEYEVEVSEVKAV